MDIPEAAGEAEAAHISIDAADISIDAADISIDAADGVSLAGAIAVDADMAAKAGPTAHDRGGGAQGAEEDDDEAALQTVHSVLAQYQQEEGVRLVFASERSSRSYLLRPRWTSTIQLCP
eukprot:COSAG06_NODE_681_length_13133_cov_6.625547_6_plen_120_part_00